MTTGVAERKMKKINYLELARTAARIADEKKANDIVILNVKRLTVVAEYFVIVTAESAPQMTAILDAIYRTLRDREGILPLHREGKASPNWSVIDYGGVVIHVMSPATRELYALEKIWSEARKVK